MLSQWVLRFFGRSQNCKEQIVASKFMSVCSSFRSSIRVTFHMGQVSYQWTDFHDI